MNFPGRAISILCRGSVLSCALLAVAFSFATATFAATTNGLSDAEIQGRQLVEKILKQVPANNFTNMGVLKIRDDNGNYRQVPVEFQTLVTATHWKTIYMTTSGSNQVRLVVTHQNDKPNQYELFKDSRPEFLSGSQTMIPFAGSDFWVADLGLEFFHWPEQKIIKREFRRNCSCMVLESTNPDPSTNGYSRVDSWIDEKSYGIVMAKAYDTHDVLLKEFYPKDIKKVDGQWEVQSMEIENDQTGSRTRLEFNFKSQ